MYWKSWTCPLQSFSGNNDTIQLNSKWQTLSHKIYRYFKKQNCIALCQSRWVHSSGYGYNKRSCYSRAVQCINHNLKKPQGNRWYFIVQSTLAESNNWLTKTKLISWPYIDISIRKKTKQYYILKIYGNIIHMYMTIIVHFHKTISFFETCHYDVKDTWLDSPFNELTCLIL